MKAQLLALLIAWSLPAWIAPGGSSPLEAGACAAAQIADSSDAEDVDAARRALRSAPSFPWYDYEDDSIKQVHVKPPRETAADRMSKWEYSESESTADWSWLRDLMNLLYRIIFWVLLILLICVLIGVLVYVVLKTEATRKERRPALSEEEIAAMDRSRMENLPFPVQRPRTNLLDEARRNYESGNVREAIIYYYSYLLVELDKHQVIHLTRGKTNRQYLGETRQQPGLATILEATMVMFEDVFFGDLPLTRERFQQSWSDLERFQQLLRQAGA